MIHEQAFARTLWICQAETGTCGQLMAILISTPSSLLTRCLLSELPYSFRQSTHGRHVLLTHCHFQTVKNEKAFSLLARASLFYITVSAFLRLIVYSICLICLYLLQWQHLCLCFDAWLKFTHPHVIQDILQSKKN